MIRLTQCLVIALLALFSYSFAYSDSLGGRWQHNGQLTNINVGNNFKLIFCNEQNNCAEGMYRGRNLIFVPQWNVSGSISRNKNLISWSNGTQWTRYQQPRNDGFILQLGQRSVGGSWFHDGRPTSILMRGDRRHFILINEAGQSSQGYIGPRGELVIPLLNLTGRVHKHGNIINWSNGTTWFKARR